MGAIADEARRRGVTRLCHFTRSVNLVKILESGQIKDTGELRRSNAAYRSTDEVRRDGHLGHVSCSVEYPNASYFRAARARDSIFREWVVLLLDVDLLDVPDCRFAEHNAGSSRAAKRSGYDGFVGMFTPNTIRFRRTATHPDWLPTSPQAEVLVPGPIPAVRILGMVVYDHEQAELETYRIRSFSTTEPLRKVFIVPEFYRPKDLEALRVGSRPQETPYAGDGG